jgi:hypothetical protein
MLSQQSAFVHMEADGSPRLPNFHAFMALKSLLILVGRFLFFAYFDPLSQNPCVLAQDSQMPIKQRQILLQHGHTFII